MKFNKTVKKFLAFALSLAMVVSSLVINDATARAEGEFEISRITWSVEDNVKMFDVEFTSAYDGETAKDPYIYCIYVDQTDSDHSAINYSNEWNWKSNFQWLNENGGMNNNYKFDKVFTIASDFAANGKAGIYLAQGTHTVYIVAYSTVEDAQADTNPVKTASKEITVPGEVETTTVHDADTVANIEITSVEKDVNNGITVKWVHPEGMDGLTQEFYIGTPDSVIEDEKHWAKNGTNNYIWGVAKGRTDVDNVVASKDDSIKVENGGDYVVRIIYKDATGAIVI